ncbi:putative lipid-transfer protein DIR1 [Carica papaya]|uniref:putative lipid-transfer protein DIR1 n=1 Tax=Carica papaya TaxID=3649 RepID=UPI000B8CCCDD|nr:putative lipid-transfer protein DIR1 [Carica papaya]
MAGITSSKVLVWWVVTALVLVMALMGAARGATGLCSIDPNKLDLCRAAVTGESPPPPTRQCCRVVRKADLPCLCSYKSVLPAFGINPTNAFALPAKCGIKTPPQCKA